MKKWMLVGFFYLNTVFSHIVSAETMYSFLNLEIVANSNSCCNISIFYLINWFFAAETIQRKETIQGRKLYEEIRYVKNNQINFQKCYGPIVIVVYYVHATLESCSRNEHVVAENYMIDTRPPLYCCFALDKERQYYLTFFQGLPNYCIFFAFLLNYI